ncbi:unnamed protein product [Onchocerca flexuosa]|uniref:COX2_TM domain-containing protein n=1 Tax=Onchocerca flexuosa TaxID=387005 RepID=A0A183HT55_9BILA|nr:unnamed protein product [Onchocerca flexuosa]
MRPETRVSHEMVSAAYCGVQILYFHGIVLFMVVVVVLLVVIYPIVISVALNGQL